MRPVNVTNKFLSDITWADKSACGFVISNQIDVWKIGISANLSLLDSFPAHLNPDEIARGSRYFQQKDRNRFIISRGALKIILGRYLGKAPGEVEFEQGKNKKPFVKNNHINLQYNLSHSGDMILLGVSGSPIGVDIEFINNDFGYSEVLADNFSTGEVKYINEAEHTGRFFKLWTRKEAITKATAQGLDCDLRLLPGLDGTHNVQSGVIDSDEDWVINSFAINEQYAASVANSPLTDKLSFFSFQTP